MVFRLCKNLPQSVMSYQRDVRTGKLVMPRTDQVVAKIIIQNLVSDQRLAEIWPKLATSKEGDLAIRAAKLIVDISIDWFTAQNKLIHQVDTERERWEVSVGRHSSDLSRLIENTYLDTTVIDGNGNSQLLSELLNSLWISAFVNERLGYQVRFEKPNEPTACRNYFVVNLMQALKDLKVKKREHIVAPLVNAALSIPDNKALSASNTKRIDSEHKNRPLFGPES